MISFLSNQTLIVTTVLSAPYCMLRNSNASVNVSLGNEQFEGYGIDVIHELSAILDFNYEIRLVPDGRHGKINHTTGQWDGLIREILDKRAQLAIADISITLDRLEVVDFSVPFMDLGISLLYRKPTKQPPNMFSFVSPLSPGVWAAMATAYVVTSVLLFGLASFTPQDNYAEVYEPHTVLERVPTLFNCFWFTMTPLTQQGCEILPSSLSTRMVAGMWWFFALIMISSYTANLAAFLTVERLDSPIKSVEDLAKQSSIKYGVYTHGSSATFFRESKSPVYQHMWSVMESTRPSVFTSSNGEGVNRVMRENGSYAFLMESVSIQYVTERHCELAQVGGQLDRKGYGIAMSKNATHLSGPVNRAVMLLHERGILNVLKTRWWKQKRGGGLCKAEAAGSSSATVLGLANVGGVMLIFICGFSLSILLVLQERRLARNKRRPMHLRVMIKKPGQVAPFFRYAD